VKGPYREKLEEPVPPKKPWRCRLGFHKWVDGSDGLPPVTEGNGLNAMGGYESVVGRYQALDCVLCGQEGLWDVHHERWL
jgi:hypothetical protein